MYQAAIKALAHAEVGHGAIDAPDGRSFLDNPLCGDCVGMEVSVANGRISAVAHQVRGCLLCRAAASLIGKHAIGMRREEVDLLESRVGEMLEKQTPPPAGWNELTVFAPVHDHPSRYTCVKLPFAALSAAMRSVVSRR
jgi:NifU-like protein involved in Fe-S cluster formation